MSYREMLEEAVGEIPPTSIDVDRVIARERRGIRLRRLGVVAAAAVTVGAVVFGATAVTGRPRAERPVAPSPTSAVVRTPAPDRGRSFTPTDMALFEALARVAPDLEWAPVPGAQDARPVWSSGPTTRGYTPDGYLGQGRVRSGGGTGDLVIQISPDWGPVPPCTPDAVKNSGCTTTIGPAGEKILTSSARVQGGPHQSQPGPAKRAMVMVERSDGVVLILTILGEGDNAPLTAAQLTAAALDPAVARVAAEPLRFDTNARRMLIDSWVLASLQRHAPGVTGAEGKAPDVTANDLGAGWNVRGGENTADSYRGQGRVLVNGVAGLFSVEIGRQGPGTSGDLTCDKPSETYACQAGTGPNGERYRTTTTRNGSGAVAEREVHVLRKDGSWLAVTLAADGAEKLALTAAQQRAIAFDPTVALADR